MADKSITMNINEVIELNYLIEEVDDDAVSYNNNPSGTTEKYLSKNTIVFDPDGKGLHTLEINGKTIDIDVIGLPSSVVHQYDASQLSGYTDGDIVSPFTDFIGSQDLSPQGTDPTYRENIQNGKSIVRTDGSDDIVSITSSNFNSISSPFTVIAVLSSVEKDTASNRTITGVADSGNDDNAGSIIWNNNGYFEFVGGPSGNNTSAPLILTGIVDGSNTVLRENGSQTASGTRSGSMDSFTLGKTGSNNWIANNDYCEVNLYNSNLDSDGDLVDEENRLADKWGITL